METHCVCKYVLMRLCIFKITENIIVVDRDIMCVFIYIYYNTPKCVCH